MGFINSGCKKIFPDHTPFASGGPWQTSPARGDLQRLNSPGIDWAPEDAEDHLGKPWKTRKTAVSWNWIGFRWFATG